MTAWRLAGTLGMVALAAGAAPAANAAADSAAPAANAAAGAKPTLLAAADSVSDAPVGAAPAGGAATGTNGAAAAGTAGPDQVHYQKTKQVDFGQQTVEGKLHRPDAGLITASESAGANGILRLREDFVDHFAAFCAEDAP